ncbi:MAG: hypothetical protein P8130_14460, partial [Deltaproteobacteria bacterium]
GNTLTCVRQVICQTANLAAFSAIVTAIGENCHHIMVVKGVCATGDRHGTKQLCPDPTGRS